MSSVTDTAGGGTHADRSSRNAVSVAETSYKRRRTRRRKRKGGRKRGPRSMGRFPFVTVAEKYLSLCEGNQKPSTLKTKRRNLYMIHRDLQTLKEQGKIESTSPKKITSEDIIHLVGLWRGRGVKEGSICKYISVLQCVLQYARNTAIACAKIEFAPLMPEDNHLDLLDTLSKDEWNAVMESANTIDSSDWYLTLGYAMIIFALTTGARSIEFINCKISDIDLTANTVNLVEVKGKGTYGKPRTSWIHVDGRSIYNTIYQNAKRSWKKMVSNLNTFFHRYKI